MVEVEVQGSASSSDVVTISLNQPANVVEKKVPQLEKSLGKALGWTVNIIEVSSSNGGAAESRTLRADVETLVSFIAVDEGEAVSFEDVTEKLQSESAALRAELVKVFGEGLQFDVLGRPQSAGSDQTVVIALGVLLGLSVLGLIVTVTLIIRFKRNEKQDSDKESFDMDRKDEGYTNSNWSKNVSETIGKGDEQPKKTVKETSEDQTVKTDTVRSKPGGHSDVWDSDIDSCAL
ncbi:uncharacterized protein LOC122973967 [Thunnus albacares]|nr:uncharacterized protein LOC122973954 [Thunnus albacares]XP_044197717.1 uncharacterized protein LOC122973967 [Thunnus albacares]